MVILKLMYDLISVKIITIQTVIKSICYFTQSISGVSCPGDSGQESSLPGRLVKCLLSSEMAPGNSHNDLEAG